MEWLLSILGEESLGHLVPFGHESDALHSLGEEGYEWTTLCGASIYGTPYGCDYWVIDCIDCIAVLARSPSSYALVS